MNKSLKQRLQPIFQTIDFHWLCLKPTSDRHSSGYEPRGNNTASTHQN